MARSEGFLKANKKGQQAWKQIVYLVVFRMFGVGACFSCLSVLSRIDVRVSSLLSDGLNSASSSTMLPMLESGKRRGRGGTIGLLGTFEGGGRGRERPMQTGPPARAPLGSLG